MFKKTFNINEQLLIFNTYDHVCHLFCLSVGRETMVYLQWFTPVQLLHNMSRVLQKYAFMWSFFKSLVYQSSSTESYAFDP